MPLQGPRRGIVSFPPVLPTNAYQRLLYRHLEPLGLELVSCRRLAVGWLRQERRSVAVLHFHWPQPYYRFSRGSRLAQCALTGARLLLFAVRLLAARALRYRIVWTVHQVCPHEPGGTPSLDRAAAFVLGHLAHVLVAHDRATATDVRRRLAVREARVHVIPHGSYVGEYANGRPRDEVRAELGIDGTFAFLAFGLVRRYKHLGTLLEAFSELRDDRVRLVIAGSPVDETVATAVRGAAAADPRVIPLLEFIADERVAEIFHAADAAVVSRTDGGTSGALVLAMSLGLPVVAARTETYEDLLGNGAAGWLFEPGDKGSLGVALAEAADDPPEAVRKGAAALERATAWNWPAIAAGLLELALPGEKTGPRDRAPRRT